MKDQTLKFLDALAHAATMQCPPKPSEDVALFVRGVWRSYGPRRESRDGHDVHVAWAPLTPHFWGVYEWDGMGWRWIDDRRTEKQAQALALTHH